MFRVHLRIIGKGVDGNFFCRSAANALLFLFITLSSSCFNFSVVFHSCTYVHVHTHNDHNTHRLFIKYTWVFHEDRKFGDKSGSSILFFGMPWAYEKTSLTSSLCAGGLQYRVLYPPVQNKCRVAIVTLLAQFPEFAFIINKRMKCCVLLIIISRDHILDFCYKYILL